MTGGGPVRVVLGTFNPAKQAALRNLLVGTPLEPVTPDQAGALEQKAEEDRPTYLGNAIDKALLYTKASGLPALASDGGAEIPELGDAWDGLRTRRFAGPSDADRIKALLDLLSGVPLEKRRVRWHEAVAVADPGGVVAAVERAGPWGRLAERADTRHSPGFWMPALWLFPPRWVAEWDLTNAERAALRTAWDEIADALSPILQCYRPGTRANMAG